MKKNVIFLICLILSIMAIGQNESQNVKMEDDVTLPEFTAVENVTHVLKADNSLLVRNYICERFSCPIKLAECRKEGTEVIQFTVTPEGKLANFKVVNSVCREADVELIRVLKKTDGMWKPGLKNGEPIAMEQEVSVMIGDYNADKIVPHFTRKAERLFECGSKSLFVNNKPKKALQFYERAVNYLPNDKALLMLRGICYYELGDDESARRDWNRIVALGGTELNGIAYNLVEMTGYSEMTNILASAAKDK